MEDTDFVGAFMLQESNRREQVDLSLLRRYHLGGDKLAREELIRRSTPLVRSLAWKYAGRGEPMDDLVQAGMVGLVKAIDRFDLDAGHRFVSFAVPNVTGEIRRHFRDHTWAVHVPRTLQELEAKVHGERRAAESRMEPEPSDESLGKTLGVPVDRIREATRCGRAYRAMSLDHPGSDGQDLLSTRGSTDEGFELVEERWALKDAMADLSERDRSVVQMRFYDELLQREIAERIGVSQMQVSRIITGALERMSEHVEAPTAAA
jgi:RNA polymerase sigma-B factor